MATLPTPFGIYIVWHPKYKEGMKIATRIYQHFATGQYLSVSGGTGVHVLYRNSSYSRTGAPQPINWDRTVDTAVVVLVDSALAGDPPWVSYFHSIIREAKLRGFGSQVFPVVVNSDGLDVCQDIQALRWDTWDKKGDERTERLTRDLTHEFIRMLRYRLEPGRTGGTDDFRNYTKSVNVFLSYSTKDAYGKDVAEAIRNWLHHHSAMSSFLASRDIPGGVQFGAAIDSSIQDSAMVVVYTDSYSSRGWCRREVIKAKHMRTPMVVADCLKSVDERSFPYMGNVPVVRMDPTDKDTIPLVVGRLLDEIFKCLLWLCAVEGLCKSSPHIDFMAKPPEMISLAALPNADYRGGRVVVYPDPPLGAEEMELFSGMDHGRRLLSLNQWQTRSKK